mmetsp:Transcript_2577/g.4988  ORF Transcript_2577/g.4988 Transcript_2577/m.4988 type:complete len:1002 (+) Transcript_2577:273-3278(+)
MSFKPGWARTPAAGISKPSGQGQSSGLAKPPSMGGSAPGGHTQHQQVTPGVPAPVSQFSNLSMGTQGRSVAAALTGERVTAASAPVDQGKTNLAPLGRVPITSGRHGKLTEQANLYQQQTKTPRSPPEAPVVASNGAPRKRYSREELLAKFGPTTQPKFPSHVNPGLISSGYETPSVHDPFDQDTLYREWQIESEKRAAASSRMTAGQGGIGNALSSERRTSRARRPDVESGLLPERTQPRGAGGPGFSADGNWRTGGGGGGGGSMSHKEPTRFGGAMRSSEKDQRWSGGDRASVGGQNSGGGRWGNLPASADRRDGRESSGGGGRWDRLSGTGGGPGSRNDRYGGSSSSYNRQHAPASGDPALDAIESARWRRQSEDEVFDEKGTFSNEAVMGGMGLDSMADASEKFAAEMEAMRQGPRHGDGLGGSPNLVPSHTTPSTPHARSEPNAVLNEALEPEVLQPPAEETAGLANPADTLGAGWDASPWATASPAATQALPQSHGWVVPPAAAQPQQTQPQQQQQQPQMPQPVIQAPIMPPLASVPLVTVVDEWFYQDPHGNVQGPFKSQEMREWLDHGYFSMDLLVRQGRGPEPFTQLGNRFPDPRKAFSLEADLEQQQQAMLLQQQQQQQLLMQQQQQQPFWNDLQQPNLLQQQQQQQQSHSLKHDQDDLLTREQQRLLCERQLQLYGGGLSGLGNLVLTPEQRSMIFNNQDQLKNLYRQKWPAGAADPAQLAQTQQQQFLLQQQQMWAAQQSLGGAATPWSSLASQTQALGKDLSQRMASSKDFVDDNDRKRTTQAAGRGTKRTSSDASKHSGELYADMPRIKRFPIRNRPQNIGSKFRGVSWHKRDRRWLARLWVNYKIKYLGSFLSEERAALAVDDEAIASIGPDAHRLNFASEEEREALREKFRKEDEAQKLAAGGVNRPKLASESAVKRTDSAAKDDADASKSTTSGGVEKGDQEGIEQKALDEQQSNESHSTAPAEPASDTNESKQVADEGLSTTS